MGWKAKPTLLPGLAGLGVLACLVLGGWAAWTAARINASRKLARVRSDFLAIWKASNAYGLDNCGINYVVDTAERRLSDPSVPLTFEWDIAARQRAGNYGGIGLTTPCAYLNSIPVDPFKPGSQYYDYFSCDSGPRSIRHMAVLRSVGPDGKPDLPLEQMRETLAGYYRSLPQPNSLTSLNSPENRQLLRGMVAPYLYDPTNGSASGGDLVMVMNMNREHYGFAWEPDSPEWRSRPAPSQPLGLEPVRLAPDWTVGQPVPPPANHLERQWTEGMVYLPPDLVASFPPDRNAEMYRLISARYGQADLDARLTAQLQDRLNLLRNHLGPFEAFFAHPAPLTPTMDDALEKWCNADPAWWAGVSFPSPSRAGPSSAVMHTYVAYDLLVLYGKSKLLYAGRLAARGEGEAALEHIAMLEGLLHYLAGKMGLETKNGQVAFPANPYLERIHNELGRLCTELRASLERQGVPAENREDKNAKPAPDGQGAVAAG